MVFETEQNWYNNLLDFFSDYNPPPKAQVVSFNVLLVLMGDKDSVTYGHGGVSVDNLNYLIKEILEIKNITILSEEDTLKIINDNNKQSYRDIIRTGGGQNVSIMCNNIPVCKIQADLLDNTSNRRRFKAYLNKYNLITKDRGGEVALSIKLS